MQKVVYSFSILGKQVLDGNIRKACRILREGDRCSSTDIMAFRDHAFRALVQHCYKCVPYYRDVMVARDIHPDEIQCTADINRFPILTKEDLRGAGERLRSSQFRGDSVLVRRSGGTTGEPIASRIEPLARALETYSFLRGLRWMGWEPGMKMVNLFGGSLGQQAQPKSMVSRVAGGIKAVALGNVMLPGFELNESTAHRYLEATSKAGDCVVMGYASTLLIFAQMVMKFGLARNRVKAVFSTAELLPETWAKTIAEAFDCPVKSYYGCGEVNSLGYQLEQGGAYAVPDEHVIVENADVESRNQSGLREGAMLVTSLFNRAQPLIRYANGDLGEIGETLFELGSRTGIRKLLGRQSDLIEKENGELISPSLLPHLVFTTQLPVHRYQFIQRDALNVEFRYEADQELSAEKEGRLREILAEHLGNRVNVAVLRTSDFLITPAGKLRVVIRENKAS